MEAQGATQHVQTQKRKPERQRDMVVPEDDKVEDWSQTLDAKFLIFHPLKKKKKKKATANIWGKGMFKISVVFCPV